jgi:hypothetical protein
LRAIAHSCSARYGHCHIGAIDADEQPGAVRGVEEIDPTQKKTEWDCAAPALAPPNRLARRLGAGLVTLHPAVISKRPSGWRRPDPFQCGFDTDFCNRFRRMAGDQSGGFARFAASLKPRSPLFSSPGKISCACDLAR